MQKWMKILSRSNQSKATQTHHGEGISRDHFYGGLYSTLSKEDEREQMVNVWKFITQFIDENEIPPSMREIGGAIGLNQQSVRRRMLKLEQQGHIQMTAKIARGLVLIHRFYELKGA